MTHELAPVINKAAESGLVKKVFDRALGLLVSATKSNAKILVTGQRSAGKTVLATHLSAESRGQPAKLSPKPLQSQHVEDYDLNIGKPFPFDFPLWMRLRKKHAGVTVPPGEEIGERSVERHDTVLMRSLEDDFFDGWIHVVSWGYTQPREHQQKARNERMKRLPTISALREQVLKEESFDFVQIAKVMDEAYCKSRNRKRLWAIIVFTKADLYGDRLPEAIKYYSPSTPSPFTKQMRNLQQSIGKKWFTWTTLPACAIGEDFQWNQETQASSISDTARQLYTHDILREIRRSISWSSNGKQP